MTSGPATCRSRISRTRRPPAFRKRAGADAATSTPAASGCRRRPGPRPAARLSGPRRDAGTTRTASAARAAARARITAAFARTDVALVVGANDVVNPAAKTNPGSPIYGMPVFNADEARAVIVLKRSMSTGFAGIENDLFVRPNTMMVLGDAKKTPREFIAG